MTEPTLTELTDRAEHARRQLLDLKRQLDSLLRPYAATVSHPAWMLLDCAEEFGPDHTLEMVRDNPAAFRFSAPLSPADFAALTPLLAAFHDAAGTLGFRVALREEVLRLQDPERPQVMTHQGRDFTFDVPTREWRYLDQPEVVYKLLVERVPNRAAPNPDDRPDRVRARRRGMSP